MRSRPALTTALFLGLSLSPARAETWILPGLANITGRNGTHFSSDVKVHNRGSAPALVRFELTLLSGETPPQPATVSVPPGETFVSSNLLLSLWGLSEKAGTALLAADQPLQISARTYNDADPSGTYGTAVEAVTQESLIAAGGVGHAPWVTESPDSSRGYRTNVGVFLALPDSSADIVLFDAAGAELGRQTVTGGPRAYQTSVSAIVAGGVPTGRAELQVRAGKATMYTTVVDNVTGDGIAVQTIPPRDGAFGTTPLDAVVNGVAHAPGREGTYFQTDVRLFNQTPAAATVQVIPLALATTTPVAVTLAPGELKEIADVLGALFQLPDGAAGALRFTSPSRVRVLARTSNVHRDGTPGTFGAFQDGTPVSTFLAAGATGTLIGLRQTSDRPGYRTNVGFLAGPGGGAARLVLLDRTGAMVAANDTAVAFTSAFGWKQPSLGDLFPGVAIPEDSTLQILPSSGSVDVFASVIDNVTGDPVVAGAEAYAPYHCPTPQVTAFLADGEALALSGPTTLRWFSDADSVGIAPGGGSGLPGTSFLTVTPAATTTYTLTAVNACGTTTATTTITVGGPAAPVAAPASARPGRLVRLSPANLARPEDVSGVVFTFPDGAAIWTEVAARLETGQLVAVVPFQPDAASPGGYRQGACSVSLELLADELTPGAPFTIEPLSLPADPAGAFRAWLDTFTAAARQKAGGITPFGGGPAALPVIEKVIGDQAAILTRVATDAAAAGSALLPLVPPSPAGPVPPDVTVTRDQLGQISAYLDNLSASSRELAGEAGGRRRGPLASIPCLRDELGMKFCYGAYFVSQAVDPSGLVTGHLNGFVSFIDLGGCEISVGAIGQGMLAVLDQLANLIQSPSLICPLLPNWLQGFRAVPSRVPASAVTQVLVQATLGPTADRTQLVSFLTQAVVQKLLDRFSRLPDGCKDAIENLAAELSQYTIPYLQAAVDGILAQLNLPGLSPRTVTVGSCDLAEVYPDPKSRVLELANDACAVQGDPAYCLRGRRPGGPATLLVRPYSTSFLFANNTRNGIFRASLLNFLDRDPYKVPMMVAGVTPTTTLGSVFSDPVAGKPVLDKQLTLGGCERLYAHDSGGSFWLSACWLDPRHWQVRTTVTGGPGTSTAASSLVRFILSGTGLDVSEDSRIKAVIDAKGGLVTSPHTHIYDFDWTGRLRTQNDQATDVTFGQAVANGPKSFSSGGLTLDQRSDGFFSLRHTLHGLIGVDPRWKESVGFKLTSTIDITHVERSRTAGSF